MGSGWLTSLINLIAGFWGAVLQYYRDKSKEDRKLADTFKAILESERQNAAMPVDGAAQRLRDSKYNDKSGS